MDPPSSRGRTLAESVGDALQQQNADVAHNSLYNFLSDSFAFLDDGTPNWFPWFVKQGTGPLP